MPHPDHPRARAVASRLDVLDSTGSTNADLVAAASADPVAWPHLSVLLTTDQRAGRGRLDRTWVAPAGTALAVSVLLDVGFIPPHARGWIPLAAGAAMTRAVRAQGLAAGLKWPNDVLVDGLKLCGILAEGVAGGRVVVGAGVNTRMPQAALPVETATSFLAQGVDVDEDALLADWLAEIDGLLAALASAGGDAIASGLHEAVASLCLTIGRSVTVSLPGGAVLAGAATGIAADGRLTVATAEGAASVSAGDVVHVR